ncbi:MAG: multidrug effflux MFS transporter [Gammaproteobacteria bacterium]
MPVNSVPQGHKAPSIALLGIASGLSPFGMAIIVPAMHTIATRYEANFTTAQFVISAYLLGLAIAQPVAGYFCDRFGRRPVMLLGFTLFVVASVLCAFAGTLNQLIALRFLQAVGVSVGTVASRAIVRDTRDEQGGARAMSFIAATMGMAPVVAPILGGGLVSVGGQRAVFLLTAAIGVAVLLGMLYQLPETRTADTLRPHWRDWMRSYKELFRSVDFMGYTLMFGFVQGSFFSFLAVGASVFATHFNLEASSFGLLWGLLTIAYVFGATIGGWANARFGAWRVLSFGVAVTLLAGWLLPLLNLLTSTSLAGVLIPLGLMMCASGAVTPNAIAGAVYTHPKIAGTSSGLSSALAIAVGGLFTVASGLIYNGDFGRIAWLVALATTLTGAAWWLTASARRATGRAA